MANASDYVHLILDIGNTRDKYAVIEAGKLRMNGESVERLDSRALQEIIGREQPTAAILSSTGESRQEVEAVLMQNLPCLHLTHETPVPFINRYSTPETLGRDRIAAMAGVRCHVKEGPALVVDAGTCITYDLLDADDVYFGGAIAPGIRLRLNAMHTFTARLPLVDWDGDTIPRLIGDSTENSMLSGALRGAASEIEGTIALYRQDFEDLQVLLTGGDAATLQACMKSRIFAVPNLVAEGLNKILIHNVF